MDIIPARTARAYRLGKGQRLRVVEVEGLQVADINIYAFPELREYFSAGATRRLEGAYATEGTELWSNPGRDRVLMRITEDSVNHQPGKHGARGHPMIYPRCTEYLYFRWGGVENHASCQESLARSISEFGLGPDDTHDSLTLFQKAGIDGDGRQFVENSDAIPGDYVELEAMVDCLVNISACPCDPDGGPIPAIVNGGVPKPLGIEIFGGK